MSTIQVFSKQAVTNGTREMTKDTTVLVDLVFIVLGILFRFAWPALWAWRQGQPPTIEDPTTLVPTFIIAAAGAVIVLAASWSLLQQADKRVRWAFAFMYGASAAWVAQPPTEKAFTLLGILP